MTLYWDILNNGDLAIWFWDQDPSADPPLYTSTPNDGWSWISRVGRPFPDMVLDPLFEAASDYYADVETVLHAVSICQEVMCEQIERQ